MFYPSETERINALIEFAGRGRSNKDITQSILSEWRTGEKAYIIRDMLDAEEYFMCRNISIRKKSRSYIDSKGCKQTNNTLFNAKMSSAFLRTAVQQKVNYAVGKPFLVSVTGKDDRLKEQYQQEWDNFITPAVRKIIKRTVAEAVTKGIGWAYVTIIDGELKIIDIQSQQLYPAWADKAHTTLDAVVRDYKIVVFICGERKEVKKVEFWNTETVERYIDNDGKLIADVDEVAVGSHMNMNDSGVSWGRVPFIALKGNEDELPLLNSIRQQIDAYDALQSKSVDALLDDIDPILVLEGFSPEMGTLTAQRQIMQNSRIVGLGSDGKAYYVQVNPNISAVQQKLESLKKDIREFGQSVDTQDIRFGSNPSGVALKSMYQDLDIYVNGLEIEFEVFIQNLKYFFDIWLEFRGIGTVQQWSEYDITVKFDRDMLINSSVDIQETVMLAQTGVSQETIDNWNPAVESHAIEEERRTREKETALTEMDMFRKIHTQEQEGKGVDMPSQV